MPSDYHYALLVDVDSTTQDLTIANLTLQHGKYGAASLHTSDLRQDTFDNVTFMDSYLSEFRFNQSQVDSLTFQNCHFIKHAIPDMRTTGKHIIFDGTGNQDHYDFHHVLFDHCHFRAESTLPPVDLTAFSKGRSSTRMVDLDGLTFQDCTFTGPYTSAINIQQDWQMDDPSCQLRNRNITIAGCDFSGCQSAIDLYPPIRQVQIVGNNQFTDCLNGIDIHFAPTSSEADSISATHSCFSDSIRIEDNHFTRIGHWDAQVFANTMRDLAYERLYGATISPGLVGWVKSQVDSLIGTQGIGIRIAGHMRDLKVSDNQFDMLGTRAISIQNVNAMEITCNIVSEPIWV